MDKNNKKAQFLLESIEKGELSEERYIKNEYDYIRRTDENPRLSIQEKKKEKAKSLKLINYYKKILEKKEKELDKIRRLYSEYHDAAKRVMIDGSTVDSHGYVITNEISCEKILRECLKILGGFKDISNKMYGKDEFKARLKMYGRGKKFLRKIKKSKAGYTFKDSVTKMQETLYLKDLASYVDDNEFLDMAIEKRGKFIRYSPKTIKLEDTNIIINLDKAFISAEKKEYRESCFEIINRIDRMMRENPSNSLAKIRSMYKEYIDKFIAYKTIEYFIEHGYLTNHPKAIERLKALVIKEAKECKKLKAEADRKFEAYIKNNSPINNYSTVIEEDKKENIPKENMSRKSENSINHKTSSGVKKNPELASLNIIYRGKYVKERLAKTDLGKLDYVEYLKIVCPEEKKLIKYVEQMQKKGQTIYKAYMKDRAKRIANNQPIITFKKFVEITYKMQYDDLNIELPIEIEEELKSKGTL